MDISGDVDLGSTNFGAFIYRKLRLLVLGTFCFILYRLWIPIQTPRLTLGRYDGHALLSARPDTQTRGSVY